MLATLKNVWKEEKTRKEILFTIGMIIVLRFGNALPIPFANLDLIKSIFGTNQGGWNMLQILDMVSGGSMETMSIFALGVGPYITASIVVQLLTYAIPALEAISKQGEEGRKKIEKITKYTGLGLGALQAFAIVQGIFARAFATGGGLEKFVAILTMIAGSQFCMWLGDLITEFGVGNGVSIVIYAGIVAKMPGHLRLMIESAKNGQMSFWLIIMMAVVFVGITVVVVLLNEGERKIPVQYAKRVVGRKMYGGQATHIPIKVNMSGVMPVIFASAILALPQTLALLIGGGFADWVGRWLTPTGWGGTIIQSIIQLLMIIFFAYFYNSIMFNSYEYSQNLQQYGGFIPGIRPGRPTQDYLDKVVKRITFIGALILAVLSIVPQLIQQAFGVSLGFGGTSIIIVVGVVLDTMRMLEAQLQMHNYRGFLNKLK